ncbi:MAG TPA: holo-ACP synthase [Candidatus Aminicenantes bacterium]|nr:MAG: ACP synthase [Candidatus Aminicenantes bacterium]HEK86103.1 holo-ACP synthase [Candidatus Aminicenantes bacterium]
MIFGVGTDIIEVQRVEDKLNRTPGLKEKLYTQLEISYCESKKFPPQHYAARFAAKEAFLKALGTGWSGGLKFSEIEIRNLESGQPVIEVYGRVKEMCGAQGINRFTVSLSHLKTYAVATVILEKINEDMEEI